jgi:hypothetical protein
MKNDFKKHLKIFESLNVYCWIAGGAIYDFFNGNTSNDIDVFFKSEKDVKKAEALLRKKGFKLILNRNVGALYQSKNGIKYDLLYISKNPEHLFHSFFDYSICCAALDNKGNFFHHEDYFKHCEKKELHYVESFPKSDLVKLKRLKKFIKRGFSIDSENLLLWLEKMDSDKKTLRKRNLSMKEIPYIKLNNLKFNIIKTKLKD